MRGRGGAYALVLAVLALLLVGTAGLRLLVGPASLLDERIGSTVLGLRLVGVGVVALAGAALAAAGVLTQGLFRNPLAAPSVIGVSAGANLGGMVALALVEVAAAVGAVAMVSELVLPLGCVVGAAGTLFVLLLVMRLRPDTLTVLLTGIILGMFLTALASLVQAMVADHWSLARALMYFSLGDLGGKGTVHLRLALPLVVVGFAAAWGLGRHLDLLLSGEDEARSLGVDVAGVRLWTVVWTALLVAAAVALGGNLAFVGLVVPHLMRPFTGTAHRRLLPASLLGGAAFTLACDTVAAVLPCGSPVPTGVITGLVGAPVFVAILLRTRRGGAWA